MSNVDLKQKLLDMNNLVDPVIKELLTTDVEQFTSEIALYQCGVGGKRIRPALVLMSGQVFGGNIDELIYPAASAEILHNATLIIDDIIDHSEFRRNEPTCWNKFGKSIAECSSFMYLASAYSSLAKVNNSSRLIELYSKTLKIIIDGEIKDILFERSGREDEDFVTTHRYREISKDDYFKMIGQKTAILLQACCQAGAICANATDEQVEAIGSFGFDLGMAFQVRDDILDIFGNEKDFGKQIGKDILEKKMGNYIILTAIERLDYSDRDTIRNIFSSEHEVSSEDVAIVTSLVDKTNAREDAELTANDFIQNAYQALGRLPQNEHTESLVDVANYIINRSK